MNFAWKIFICTSLFMTLILSISGYAFLSSEFDSLLKNQIDSAVHDNAMLRIAFETAAANNLTSFPDSVDNNSIISIATSINKNTGEKTTLRISDNEQNILYCSRSISFSNKWTSQVSENEVKYYFDSSDEQKYILCVSSSYVAGRRLYFENITDITDIFVIIDEQTYTFRNLTIIFLIISSVILFIISVSLTRPLKGLTEVTKRIADGEYNLRAGTNSKDEIGMFVKDFNKMTDSLEEKIYALEEDAKQKEMFVSDFCHELKTPMTSIIGYADVIRSNQLSDKELMKSANYIFSEGKRLEALSLKLLELNSLTKTEINFTYTEAKSFTEKIAFSVKPSMAQKNIRFLYSAQSYELYLEPELFSDMLINLIDNARKAVSENGCITLTGIAEDNGYAFYVEDNGYGIPEEQLDKITRAFYMVDKSRSRAQNGAGLGLSLCERIAQIHGSKLEFSSKVGEGTSVRIFLSNTENKNESI